MINKLQALFELNPAINVLMTIHTVVIFIQFLVGVFNKKKTIIYYTLIALIAIVIIYYFAPIKPLVGSAELYLVLFLVVMLFMYSVILDWDK